MTRSFRLVPIVLLVGSLVLLASCVPGATVVQAPTVTVGPEGARLVRLEPPGVGRGSALIRLDLELGNPNPVGLTLAGLDGELFLSGRSVATSRFPGGLTIPARGDAPLTLEVEVPLDGAAGVADAMARLVRGEGVPYRLELALQVEALGVAQRFPARPVASGEVRFQGQLRAPTVRFDGSASQVRVDGLTARIEVGLRIDNPGPIGFVATSPELELRLDGRSVGRASMPRTDVPAASEVPAFVSVEVGVAQVGAALLSRLRTGGRGLEIAVRGVASFDVPGVTRLAAGLAGTGGQLR